MFTHTASPDIFDTSIFSKEIFVDRRKRWKCFFPESSLLESVYVSENIKQRVTVLVHFPFPQKYWKHFFLQVYT